MTAPHLRFFCRLAALLALLVCLFGLPAPAASVNAETRKRGDAPRRVLVISLDGLDARYLTRRDELKLKIPTLRRLLAEGVTSRAGVVSIYPSLTYPAHTTIVTGARPIRHGIFANEVFDPWHPTANVGIWFARDIRAATLWEAAARRGLSTGMVSWPVAAGAGDWNVPEIWKPGGTKQDDLREMVANARPRGLVEEVAAARGVAALYGRATKDEQDDMRTVFAEYIIAEKRPHVMLVHLFDFDHFQHDFGPFTPEADALLEKSDAYIGRLLAASERAGTLSETAIFIVSDHGFRPISKKINPGVVLRQAGLITTREARDESGRKSVVVTDWRAGVQVTAGSCAIILRDAKDADALRRARRALQNFVAPQGAAPGAFRVLEAVEVRRLGGNPRAALMLEGAAGYAFGAEVTGEALMESDKRGQHGYLPTLPRYRASFIAAGAGVRRRGDLGPVRMIDIGPAIARTLGLKLWDAEGRAFRLD